MTDEEMRELLKEYHKKSLDFAVAMLVLAAQSAKDKSFKYAMAYLSLAAAADPTRALSGDPRTLED